MGKNGDAILARLVLFAGLVLLLPSAGVAQTAVKSEPGVVRGPGTAEPIKRGSKPGYDHPNQYLGIHAKPIAENMEPVIEHPEQAARLRRS